MQRTHRGVALDTVFDENGTRRGIKVKVKYLHPFKFYVAHTLQAGGLHSTEMLLFLTTVLG